MTIWDYEAVTYESSVYCAGCLPDGISIDDDEVKPLFPTREWVYTPVCEKCGREHD